MTASRTAAWPVTPRRFHATATKAIAPATSSSAPRPSSTCWGLSRCRGGPAAPAGVRRPRLTLRPRPRRRRDRGRVDRGRGQGAGGPGGDAGGAAGAARGRAREPPSAGSPAAGRGRGELVDGGADAGHHQGGLAPPRAARRWGTAPDPRPAAGRPQTGHGRPGGRVMPRMVGPGRDRSGGGSLVCGQPMQWMSPARWSSRPPQSAYPGISDHRHRTRTARRRPHPDPRARPAGAARRPDRPGRPQRRRQDHHAQGAGRRGPAVRRRGRRTSEVGYLPQDPRTGDLNVTARDRVLSARGLDVLLAEMQKLEVAPSWPRAPTRQADPPVRPPGGPVRQPRRVRGRGRGRPDLRQPGPARPGAGADHRHPLRRPAPPRSSWPASCSATPARTARASCCSTSRPTTWTPTRSPGCAGTWPAQGRPGRDQPRRRAARGRGQQGLVSGRQPLGRRHLQRGLEDATWTARDRRAPAPPRAGQRREEGRRADGAGRQDAGQGDQDGGRAEHGPARREAAARPGGGTRLATRSPRCASRTRRPAARRR